MVFGSDPDRPTLGPALCACWRYRHVYIGRDGGGRGVEEALLYDSNRSNGFATFIRVKGPRGAQTRGTVRRRERLLLADNKAVIFVGRPVSAGARLRYAQ